MTNISLHCVDLTDANSVNDKRFTELYLCGNNGLAAFHITCIGKERKEVELCEKDKSRYKAL